MNAVLRPPAIVTAIQSRVPWDDYLALPGVSITRLKELGRSPQHYRYRLANPKETTPLSLGRAAHCAVLEPERFARDHAIWERRTEAGVMAPRQGKHWDAFRLAHEGRAIISADEMDKVRALQLAVRSNPDAMRYLELGDPEVTLQWEIRGFQGKGRVDWLTTCRDTGRPVLVGLKTARDCRHYPFGSQAARLGYHLQWAYYYDAFKLITGREPLVKEIVVENEGPHAVSVFNIPDDILQQGCDEYLALLDRLDECERNKTWPGPAIGEQDLTLPSWAYDRDEDVSDLGLEA